MVRRANSFAVTGLKNACTRVQDICVYNKYVSQTFLEEKNIVNSDLRNMCFLILSGQSPGSRNQLPFGLNCLCTRIIYKKEQNIMITNSYKWLIHMLCFMFSFWSRLDKCAHVYKEQKAQCLIKEVGFRKWRQGRVNYYGKMISLFFYFSHFELLLLAENVVECFLDYHDWEDNREGKRNV